MSFEIFENAFVFKFYFITYLFSKFVKKCAKIDGERIFFLNSEGLEDFLKTWCKGQTFRIPLHSLFGS